MDTLNVRATLRKSRITDIHNLVKKAKLQTRVISIRKVIAYASFNWGVTKRTAKEYIDTLVNYGILKKDMDELTIISEGKPKK